MPTTLEGKRVAFLATDGVEEVEYTQPREAVEQAGGQAELISIKPGQIQAFRHLDKSGTYPVDRTVAFLATEGVEQVELEQPMAAVRDAGGVVHLVAPDSEVQAFHHLDKGDTFPADRKISDANPGNYDALVLPGGVANPDALRTDEEAVGFVKAFVESGKLVAAICHASWTLVEAGVVDGKRLTSWPSLQTDIRNAGGEWVDEEVVVCDCGSGKLITSRKPDDIPAFNRALLEALAEAHDQGEVSGRD